MSGKLGAVTRGWHINPDPTTRAGWLVKGETELGPQRRCRECRQWWPLDAEMWTSQVQKGKRYFYQPCRACSQPANRAAVERFRKRRKSLVDNA